MYQHKRNLHSLEKGKNFAMDPHVCMLISSCPRLQGPLSLAEKLGFIPRAPCPAKERSQCRNWNPEEKEMPSSLRGRSAKGVGRKQTWS